jgi:hypothetical protein
MEVVKWLRADQNNWLPEEHKLMESIKKKWWNFDLESD